MSVTVNGEVLKQNGPTSRPTTAEWMDQLSEPVVIQPEVSRIRHEVKSFISGGLIWAATPLLETHVDLAVVDGRHLQTDDRHLAGRTPVGHGKGVD
jgi:hypothetical protein